MYTLLIVDDEHWVRQGLRTTVDWEALRIEVIGEASDGGEALELMQEKVPDIVLTDIKMPDMDGLALMEEMRARGWTSQVVVISGYDDFHFAQKALRCGAVDYILKPIQETTLAGVILQCLERLERNSRQKLQMSSMHLRLQESVPLARERHLEMLLYGELRCAPDRLGDKWRALGIPLDPQCVRAVAAWVHEWGEKGRTERDRKSIVYALGNMAEEIAAAAGSAAACAVQEETAQLAVLVSGISGDKMKALYRELVEAAASLLGIGVTIGIGGERDALTASVSFREAKQAVLTAFCEGFGSVYEHRAPSGPETAASADPGPAWYNRLLVAMKLCEEPLIRECLGEWIDALQALRPNVPPHALYRSAARTVRVLADKWEQRIAFEAHRKPSGPDAAATIRMPACTIDELGRQLHGMLLAASGRARLWSRHSRIVQLALAYVHQHYAEPISMNDVAEAHHVNASYFSNLFREEVGETFSKYLMRLRMDKAKQFLAESTLKVYEVAYKVGYNDYRHFAKTFKEVEGVTPAQFREWGCCT
jgi:two-component system response regulator YesN